MRKHRGRLFTCVLVLLTASCGTFLSFDDDGDDDDAPPKVAPDGSVDATSTTGEGSVSFQSATARLRATPPRPM